MPVTLIVEPNPGGHRFDVAADVAGLADRFSDVVLLTSRGSAGRPEFQVRLAAMDLAVDEAFDSPAPTTRQLADTVAAFCRSNDVETVVLLDGDTPLKQWWLVAARAFRGLARRPRVVFFLTRYPAAAGMRDLPRWRLRAAKDALVLAAMATRTLHRASGYAARDEPKPGRIVKRVRDTAVCSVHASERDRWRTELGLPLDRPLVGLCGGVGPRKLPELVFDAVRAAGDDVLLVAAGPMSEITAAWIESLPPEQQQRIVVAAGFLPNEVLDRYIAAVDVHALAMILEGPSGIMGKALAAGVPVVSAGSQARARELVTTGGGVSTELTAAAFAHGIRTVLDAPPGTYAPTLDAVPTVTSDSFAATILGRDLEQQAGSGSRLGRVRHLAERVRHKLTRTAVAAYLRPKPSPDLVRLGSDYGGWWVPESALGPDVVAYCGGAGEDITFDLELHARGCRVTTFDPTPRAIAHATANAPQDDRFRFSPVGWWDTTEELRFYSPRNPLFVSHSAVNLRGTDSWFVAPVKPVHELMAELGDDHVDLVKLDIEGAEHRVLASLLADGPRPSVLCVEFDQPQPVRRVIARVRTLQRAGYTLRKIDGWNYTFTRPQER